MNVTSNKNGTGLESEENTVAEESEGCGNTAINFRKMTFQRVIKINTNFDTPRH